MYALVELTADQVLQAFRRDGPSLFLGAMIMAVGLVAAAFYTLRGKHDPILVYFAFFAALYGLRMWIKADVLSLTMQGSPFFPRARSAIDFIVPMPAFLFFNAAGLLHRWFKTAVCALGIVIGLFGVATLWVGPRDISYQITGVLIIGALIILVVQSMRTSSLDRDFVVIRRGLLIFVAFAVWENIRGVLGLHFPNIEAIGFAAFLVALGYVAARQTLQRDQQLREIQNELEIARRISCRFCRQRFRTPPTSGLPPAMCR
jgi:sigma-B regulation protein RsbU (phosphoserine phosphatase)